MSPTVRLRIQLWLVLLALIAGNYLVRSEFEKWDHRSYLLLCAEDVGELQAHPWKALLPISIGGGQTWWAATSQLVVEIMNRAMTPTSTFLLLNAAVIFMTFWTSWFALHSRIFTFTTSLCMAFGTQFHYSYALSGTFAMYIQVIYLEWILLCLFRLLNKPKSPRAWQIGYAIGLVVYAMGFDHWYNFLLFIWLSVPVLYWYYRRCGASDVVRQLRFVIVTTTVVACIHLPIKLSFSEQHFQPGREDELIVGYRYPVLVVEDFISNVMTYTFMSLTNYAPPAVMGSNSDFMLGSERILEEQHGYHEALSGLVPNHHRFLWYYYAGIVFSIYVFCLSQATYRAFTLKSSRWLSAAIILIGVLAGVGTHALIKFRPYMSVPSLSYKCIPSILATTILIGFVLMLTRQRLGNRWTSAMAVCLVWTTILYSGMTRPRLLSHLNAQVGLAKLPDPVQGAERWAQKCRQRLSHAPAESGADATIAR